MDPNANLQEQERLLVARKVYPSIASIPRENTARLIELRRALREWLSAGGFQPNWSACNRASAYFGR